MPEKLSRRNFLRRLRGASAIAPAAVGLTTTGLWVPEARAASPARLEFEVHGTSVQIEFPDRVEAIFRVGWGTFVRQAPGTDNWFHFAIPTPLMHDDGIVKYQDVYLSAKLALNTQLDSLAVWSGDSLVVRFDNLSFIGEWLNRVRWDIPDVSWHLLGLGISVHVNWLGGAGTGEVHFMSAGASFED